MNDSHSERSVRVSIDSETGRVCGIASRPFDKIDESRIISQGLEVTVPGEGVGLRVTESDRFLEAAERFPPIATQRGHPGHRAQRLERLGIVSAECLATQLESLSMEILSLVEATLRGENDREVVLRGQGLGVIPTEYSSFGFQSLLVEALRFVEPTLSFVDDRQIVG
jgi:hypothetical protein